MSDKPLTSIYNFVIIDNTTTEKEDFIMSKNLGSNFNHRVTLRLTDDQFNFIVGISDILGVSPSEYIRMVINAGMVTSKEDIIQGLEKVEVGTNEDVKTDKHNIV